MKANNTAKVIAMTLLVFSSWSCQKEITVSPNTPIPGKLGSKDIQANYFFDWDNPSVTTMPVSTRLNSPAVSVPWRSNGGLPLDPAIVNDYHRVDGWDLVYCSFSPDDFPNTGINGVVATAASLPTGGLYFALYNRFRGTLRYYLYVPPQSYGYSTQIEHGLQVYSTSNKTSALDFEKGEIADPAYPLSNGQGFTKTNKDGLPTTGGWYAMQYQIAYDTSIAGSTYTNPSFRWDAYSVSISQINLNGTEIGTSRGIIHTPAPDFDFANLAVNAVATFVEVVATSGSGPAATAIASGIAGNTTGFLSGLFGNTAASEQTVDLKINADISTTGTTRSSSSYLSNAMPFPTQQIAGSNAVQPLLNYPMGVFNLSKRPLVKVSAVPVAGGSANAAYTIDGSVEKDLFKLNPFLDPQATSSGATYSNFKTEVVVLFPSSPLVSGKNETIGAYNVYTGINSVTTTDYAHFRRATVGVRVSFTLTPVDTRAKKQFIVQTFYASVIKV